jgi:hypothetical protein
MNLEYSILNKPVKKDKHCMISLTQGTYSSQNSYRQKEGWWFPWLGLLLIIGEQKIIFNGYRVSVHKHEKDE